jgi:hypothetical protein
MSTKVRQSSFMDPFSLQSKELQPDYVSSHKNIMHKLSLCWSGLIVNEKQHVWEEKNPLMVFLNYLFFLFTIFFVLIGLFLPLSMPFFLFRHTF